VDPLAMIVSEAAGFTADEIQRLWQDAIYSVYQDVTKAVCSMYCKIVIEHTNYILISGGLPTIIGG
jgi:hypothetical protein